MKKACACLAAVAIGSSAFAGIADLPNLQSISVFERTGGSAPVPATFPAASPQLNTRLANLSGSSLDFQGAGSEWYDVFYSDADGTPNASGDWLTIECVFVSTAGGGCNIAEVRLNFAGGTTEFANVVTNVRSGGSGAFPSTAVLAVDGDLQTHTTLGTGTNTNRLGITVSFASVPTPGAAGLAGLAGLALLRRRR
jgi:MYXO-CTERM domain-containing protein